MLSGFTLRYLCTLSLNSRSIFLSFGAVWDLARTYLLLEGFEDHVLGLTHGDVEEVAVEAGQLSRAEVAHIPHGIPLKLMSPFAQHLSGGPRSGPSRASCRTSGLGTPSYTRRSLHIWPGLDGTALNSTLNFCVPLHHTFSLSRARPGQRFTQTWHTVQRAFTP